MYNSIRVLSIGVIAFATATCGDSTTVLPFAIDIPKGVTDLEVIAVNADRVSLEWTQVDDGTGSPASYWVGYGPVVSVQSVQENGTSVLGSEIGAPATHTATGLEPDTEYQFQVVSYRESEDNTIIFIGPGSNVVTETTLADPVLGTITDLSADPGDGQVGLSWTPAGNATSQQPQFSGDGGGSWANFGPALAADASSATVTALVNGTQYLFRIVAGDGTSTANSNSAAATPQSTGLGAITDLNASRGNGQVTLSWTPAANATSHQPQVSTNGGGTWTSFGSALGGGASSVTVTGLLNGTLYTFRVVAGDGTSTTNSNTDDATPLDDSTGRDAILDANYPTPVAPDPLRTFYVDAQNGNDAGVGTEADPWQTFPKIQNTAQAGDRFYLRGRFDDVFGWTGARAAGTANSPIQLIAWPGHSSTIASNQSDTPTFFLWAEMDYYWLEGLTIERGAYNLGVPSFRPQKGSVGHTLVNNTFDDSAIQLIGSPDTRIYENTFTGTIGGESSNTGDAIFTQDGSDDVEIVRNTFTADIWHVTITIGGYQSAAEADVLDNVVVRNTIQNTAAGGINVNGKGVRTIIAGNDIEMVGTQDSPSVASKTGIFLAGREADVFWNRVWGSESNALKIQAYTFGGYAQLGSDNHIYNNTFFGSGGPAILMVLQSNVPGLTGNVIENNIFWKNNLEGESTHNSNNYEIWAVFFHTGGQTNRWTGTNAQGNVIRNNLMANASSPDGGWILIVRQVGDGGNTSYTLNGAEANFSDWEQNLEADPLFVSEAAPDFTLGASSPAIDVGRLIAGMSFLGSAPDLGAVENR